MKTHIDIIIMQTSMYGYMHAVETITRMGAEEKSVIFDEFEPAKIQALIDPVRPQLFLTGSDHGEQEYVVELLKKFRAKYPKLQCVCLAASRFRDESAFHMSVDRRAREGEPTSLKGVITTFLSQVDSQ